MADFSIKAGKREIIGKKVKQLRRQGVVPGTIYGPKTQPVSVQFNYRELEMTLRDAGGTNVIDIEVDGDKTYPTLARDVQRSILKRELLHVDFFAVDMDSKIRIEVPVIVEGVSPLVQAREGIMLTGPNTLTIETLPTKMLNQIVVDVSMLDEMGATISVKDLDLGEGSIIINDPEEMIAKIVQPSAARAEQAAAELAEGEEGELAEGEEGEEDEEG